MESDANTWAPSDGADGGDDLKGLLPDRYTPLSYLAGGGMSAIWRVRDRLLGGTVAMKVSLPGLAEDASLRRRFLDEARLTSQLNHPGVISVRDMGELSDGRLFFTMEEVQGRDLEALLAAYHAAPEGSGWTLRRLLSLFRRVCEAVAYAHSRGVLHRDLKPANLMVGGFGEVRVMDWGLARWVDEDDPEGGIDLGSRDGGGTQAGQVMGTPAYMPPEQARGQIHRLGPEADIYALGAVLYTLLSGRRPYPGGAMEALQALLAGPPTPLDRAVIPPALCDICELAMDRDPMVRHLDAEALAEDVAAWLDGEKRREDALALVTRADALVPEIQALRAEADQHRGEANAVLEPLKPYDPVEQKLPGWTLEDRAAARERAARLKELEYIQQLRGALTTEPELVEAHDRLADHYKARLMEAEQRRDGDAAAEFEVLTRTHDRGRHTAWLKGDGAVTLVTDPPGAVVELYEYVEKDRRLVEEPRGILGETPLYEVSLPRGSYLLLLKAPGRATVRYPVLIERASHWDGVPPDETSPYPIYLPSLDEFGQNDCYVPAGWFWSGGDPDAPDSWPLQRWWTASFVVQKHPVTNSDYLAFLNALVAEGRPEEAQLHAPREPGQQVADEQSNYNQNKEGYFYFSPDWRGRGSPNSPVTLISWWSAHSYASWAQATTGRDWRLLHDLEWEKAARGVDRRLMPWGDYLEPTWSCNARSTSLPQSWRPIHEYKTDIGPLNLTGTAGNVRTWCENPYLRTPPTPAHPIIVPTKHIPGDDTFMMVRGGAWNSNPRVCRLASRYANRPKVRMRPVGIRLCWDISQFGQLPSTAS